MLKIPLLPRLILLDMNSSYKEGSKPLGPTIVVLSGLIHPGLSGTLGGPFPELPEVEAL